MADRTAGGSAVVGRRIDEGLFHRAFIHAAADSFSLFYRMGQRPPSHACEPTPMRPLPTLLTLAIAAAFGGFVATGINAHLDNRADAAPLPAALPATAALPASVAGQPVPSLAPMLEKTMPAVVSVNTKQVVRVRNPFFNDPFFRRLFPDIPQERINESLGSGVIIDAKEGLVLTNHHVIENADECR